MIALRNDDRLKSRAAYKDTIVVFLNMNMVLRGSEAKNRGSELMPCMRFAAKAKDSGAMRRAHVLRWQFN